MNKLFFLLISSSFFGFEQLDSRYLIQYGTEDAKSHAIEYFSLSCPKCIEFFLKEFPSIKSRYIDPGFLSWTFHPDPADLLTLQAMVCLDRLPPSRKTIFLEMVMENLAKFKNKDLGCQLLKTAMEVLDNPQPGLEDLEFLKTAQAFQDAFAFVSQKDVIQIIPSIEIDGHLYTQIPSLALIDAHMKPLPRSL